jgi:hypothetical protein
MIGICPVLATGNVNDERRASGLKDEVILIVKSLGVSAVELL